MNLDETNSSSKIWGIAAVAGVLAFLALKVLAGYGFGAALLLAILIAVLVAILLWIGFFRDADEVSDDGEQTAGSPDAPVAATAAEPATIMSEAMETDVTRAKTAKKPAKKAAKAKASKPKATAKKAPAKKAPAKKAKTAVAKDGKPETLSQARAGGADDFKRIKGVGPGLEKTLNELGFYHYDQVSSWRAKEIQWVDDRLKFKGRIVRDDWVKQAKALAKG